MRPRASDDSSNVAAAVATASSTSASVGTPISATTPSSYGLLTSNVPSPVRHSPFTRNGLISVMWKSPPFSAATGAPRRTPRSPVIVRPRVVVGQSSETITCLMFV